jgi:hypothetical protein
MWIILLSDGIEQRRDDRISNLLGERVNEIYLGKISSNTKYSVAYNLKYAITYTTESGAKRMADEFNNYDPVKLSNWNNKFSWIKNYKMSIRKLTPYEWNSIINDKINVSELRHKKNIEKLEKQRLKYK